MEGKKSAKIKSWINSKQKYYTGVKKAERNNAFSFGRRTGRSKLYGTTEDKIKKKYWPKRLFDRYSTAGFRSLKTLYREFKSGKKPIDILAEHSFHPDAVEIEYRRFIELSERDNDELLKQIMLKVIQKGYEKEPLRNINIKTLIERSGQRGYLTKNEISELLALYIEAEVQHKMDLSLFDPSRRLPRGFRRLRCSNCDNTHIGVIVHDKLPLGRELVNRYDGKGLCHVCQSEKNSGGGY
jgi:hypothetical protein